jgi:hypothetical protein
MYTIDCNLVPFITILKVSRNTADRKVSCETRGNEYFLNGSDVDVSHSELLGFFDFFDFFALMLIHLVLFATFVSQISTSFSILVPRKCVLYHNFYCIFSGHLPPN